MLTRAVRALSAAGPLGMLFLLAGCGDTSDGEFRTVTEADTAGYSASAEDGASGTPGDEVRSPPEQPSDSTAQEATEDPPSTSPAEASPDDASEADTVLSATDPNMSDPSVPQPEPTSPGTTPADSTATTDPTAALVKPIKLLVPEQTFSVEGPEGALRISYDDFDLEKVLNVTIAPPGIEKHFPEWLSDLEGKRVRVRGFMYPTFQETDLGGFVLARDYGVCCFGPQGKIYHLVEVAMREGETTDYIHARPFDVVGEFHIRPDDDGEELLQLYQIEDAVVIEK